MKRFIRPVLALALSMALPSLSFARICPLSGNFYNQTTNPPTNDQWSMGGRYVNGSCVSKTEVVLDYLGNWEPSTNNQQTLGTSSLQWSNVYATAGTFGTGGISNTGPLQGTYVSLTPTTTTQIAALTMSAVPIGTTILVKEDLTSTGLPISNAFNVCVSTSQTANTAGQKAAGATDWTYVAVTTNTNAAGGGAQLGGGCNQ